MNQAFNSAGVFQQLPSELQAEVGTGFVWSHYRPGEMIFAEGERGDRLYVVDFGKVKITRAAAAGRSGVQAVLGPADIFGELAVYDPGPRTSSATAITEVRVVSMSRVALRRWIHDRPEIVEQLLRLLARRIRRTIDDQAGLVSSDVPGRLAKQLLELAQRFGSQADGATRLVHDLTHDDFARLIGSTGENVNRSLVDFCRRGWIRQDGHTVVILDSERLMRRAR